MNTFKIPNAFEVGLKGVGIDPAMVLRRSGLPLNLWSSGKGMATTEQFFGSARMEKSLHGQVTIFTGVSRSQGLGASICRIIPSLVSHLFLTASPSTYQP